MYKNDKLLKMVLSALFLALAFIMPFFTGQIQGFGQMLCPLHIPILLCGFICGWKFGLIIGFIAPLLRSLTLGAPPFFPTAIAMSFELATYGMMTGIIYKNSSKNILTIYISLILSMIIGRVVWGLIMFILLGITGGTFTFSAFIAGSVINAIPGIIIQIILIPAILILINKNLYIIGKTKNK